MTFNPIIPVFILIPICIIMLLFKRRGLWNYIRQIIIVVLIFVICLRPSVPTDEIEVVSSNIDVLFVIDNTISMLAEDYGNKKERRLNGVVDTVDTVIEEFPDARYAVVTFSNKSQLLINYTTEKQVITDAVSALDGYATYYAEGTTLNDSYDAMKELFKDTERQEDDKANTETKHDRVQVVFYMSDGEITIDEKLRDFSPLEDYIDAGAVFGYGTKEGGPMKARKGIYSDTHEYVEYYDDNFNKKLAISSINEKNLEQIADDLGIEYLHVKRQSDVEDAIEDVLKEIEDREVKRAKKSGEGRLEIYFILAIALGAFVVYDFIYYRHKLSKEG